MSQIETPSSLATPAFSIRKSTLKSTVLHGALQPKMKNIILAITLTLATLTVAGQNHSVGIKGGASWSNVSSKNFPRQNDSRQGITGGFTYEYIFPKRVTVGADLIYSQRGFTNEIMHTDDLGNQTSGKATLEFTYDYLSLPIKIGYTTDGNLYSFGNIGLVPSLLIDAKTRRPTFDNGGRVTGTETIDITDRVTDTDFAGLVEIGAGYKISDSFDLFSTFSYQRSLTTITNSEYFTNTTIRHSGTTLYIGVKCSLNHTIND